MMKDDKPSDPVHIGLFSADAVVLEADFVADLV
jgi:hypothetical protein